MSLPITRRTAAKALVATAAGGMMPGATAQSSPADRHHASDERIRAEVCVIGGGSGGTGAALAAARAGAKVVLVERESILGGTATNAFVNIWRPVAGLKGVHNLMIASRAAGFSHIASGAVRLQRTLMTLGQAAGNAAAIASKRRIGVAEVDVAELQARLRERRVDMTAPPEPT